MIKLAENRFAFSLWTVPEVSKYRFWPVDKDWKLTMCLEHL